ncbi:MAG: hypothetical protein V4772_13705 [Pseudomonadota bacterium]
MTSIKSDLSPSSASAPVTRPSTGLQSEDQPLGLTVHNVPVPDQASAASRSGRWKMIAVLLVCAAPVLASYFTYYLVRPEGRRNFGALVDPQKPIPAIPTTSLDGKKADLLELKNQWLLISVASGSCGQPCQQRLYFQRQLREALGKEKDRLDRVWLINDDAPVDERLRPALAASTVLRVPAAALSQWLAPADGQQLEDHIYLVDPLGNWMMRFPANMDATGAASAKRDLDRLLRASASWDKEGR